MQHPHLLSEFGVAGFTLHFLKIMMIYYCYTGVRFRSFPSLITGMSLSTLYIVFLDFIFVRKWFLVLIDVQTILRRAGVVWLVHLRLYSVYYKLILW